MAYIIIIEPQILHQAGMGLHQSFWAVVLITAFSSILCGLVSNLPFGFAPGLGLLSFFAYVVVAKMGLPYSAGLAAVFIAGLLFFLITLTRIRSLILEAIPKSLGCAIAAGIGFFIGLIALRNTGLIVSSPVTLVQLGSITQPSVLLFFLGFLIIAILDKKNIPGAILVGILLVTLLGWVFKISPFYGVTSFELPNIHQMGHFDFHAIANKHAWPLIFTFLMVALFDSTGTMLGLSHQMDLKNTAKNSDSSNLSRDSNSGQNFKKINMALMGESIASMVSSVLGASTIAAFVESASGIRAGGKTGLVGVTVGVLFLFTLLFAPLAESIPSYATACGLFYVSCQMFRPFALVLWDEVSEFIPAVITLVMIPLTFSIADGVGLGLICYLILKIAGGEISKIHPVLWVLTLVFIIYFAV